MKKRKMEIYVLCMKELQVAYATFYCNKRMANKIAKERDMRVVKFIEAYRKG